MKNVKAIIFDAYGTLFDVNSAAEKCKDKIGDKWEPFANFWRTTQLEYTWLRSLMTRHKDFWQITEDSLDKSIKAFEIDSSMRDELLNLYKVLSPFKEVHKTLKTLHDFITTTSFNLFSSASFLHTPLPLLRPLRSDAQTYPRLKLSPCNFLKIVSNSF